MYSWFTQIFGTNVNDLRNELLFYPHNFSPSLWCDSILGISLCKSAIFRGQIVSVYLFSIEAKVLIYERGKSGIPMEEM